MALKGIDRYFERALKSISTGSWIAGLGDADLVRRVFDDDLHVILRCINVVTCLRLCCARYNFIYPFQGYIFVVFHAHPSSRWKPKLI
jgi:hypothetical protein